jgi:rhamnulokinase
MQKVLSKVPREAIYQETGVCPVPANTLFQLATEKSRRLSRAQHLLPVADAFNYLLAGVPRCEMSQASTTQLYSPMTKTWSNRLLQVLDLPPRLFPPLVPAGTELGPLRPDIAKSTGLEDALVVASCSHETAAALAGLPIGPGESWAYLRFGSWTVMGTELAAPIITDTSRRLNFTNEMGYGGSVRFSKQTAGLWLLEECRRFWKERDREIDDRLLTHLAGSSPPFESLINPADPRFLEPGDMPLKIQAFCRETGQPVPRKPGPIIRCVLESIALQFRKTLQELEEITGRQIGRLYLLDGSANALLNQFTTNALRRPLVVAPADAAAIGNVVVQALALGHIQSVDQAREILRNSLKAQTLLPYAAAWDTAYERLMRLCAA